MNFWQCKLLAFLHDPPHKALDIPGHEDNRNTFVTQAGFDSSGALQWFDKSADWWASAADRFPGFDSKLQSPFGGNEHTFKHPLGGSELIIPEFPSPEALGEHLQVVQPHGGGLLDKFSGEERDRINFFLHWRRWPVEAAQKEWRSAFQPADTRLPDHPIWLHNSITSAIQGCESKPAFLMFQLGPVQDFIAQARSTRDLWSGSYLLSWLMAHAIKAITDQVGPDAVIYPFLRAQPLFDLLHRDEIYRKIPMKDVTGETLWDRMKLNEREMLVPNFPNKFLALVPAPKAENLAKSATQAAQAELAKIADASWKWINEQQPLKSNWRTRFDLQIAQFLQITWQTYTWPLDAAAWPSLASVFHVPSSVFPPNPGLFWSHHYAEADRLLAARRNTRDFRPWMLDENGRPLDVNLAGTPKDTLSGKEEIIGDEDWWKEVQNRRELKFLFRSSDKLGAINLVKKVWHKAYLANKDGWNLYVRKVLDFESVPGVAAGWWRKQVVEKLKTAETCWKALLALIPEIKKAASEVGLELRHTDNERKFVEENDPEIFFDETWRETWRETCSEVANRIAEFLKESNLSKPPKYYAVIAMDGDEMGKWMSGEKTPPLIEQFSREARERFKDCQLEGVNRPLSPSYHLQFTEALANFALYLARPIVEHFGGQLIYAGGDDVMAMLPAAQALDCAEALRAGFKGQKRLEELVPGKFEVCGSQGGFVKLRDPKAEQPTWPLIVPGPKAEVSAGIAIGHMHSPLQNLVEAARQAEKRAKKDEAKGGYGKSAFAISLFKRSGETIQWGAKWDCAAIELAQIFDENSGEGKPLSGRFPYALAELLRQYDTPTRKNGKLDPFRIGTTEQFDALAVIRKDLEHVVRQQGKNVPQSFVNTAERYLGECVGRRLDDFLGPFLTTTFIRRGGGE